MISSLKDFCNFLKNKKTEVLEDLTKERGRQYPSFKREQRLQGQLEAYGDMIEVVERNIKNEERQL